MCETKTKKRLIGLFLIPLILSIIVSAVTFGGHTAYAVTNPGGGGGPVCTLSATIYYFGSSSKQTIIQEQVGDNPDGSACSIGTTTFQKMAAPPFEYKVGGNNGKCGDTVTLNGGNAADATYQAMAIPTGGFICNKSGNAQSVAVGDTRTAALAAVTAQNGTGTQQQTTDCSISDGLGWILCPVMRMGAGIADAALGYISGSFLEVNYQLYSTNSATYNAWQWVLGFANIFFVIIFLIIIFSQATGFGISSYGIKKMLPKLIVGVVLINLSFFICSIMIDASNVTGYGLNHFFDTLAQGIKLPANTDIGANGSPFTDIVVDIIGVVAAAAVIIAAIAFFGPVLLAAIVALLMIFLFLVARQAIIILAIIVAPLAFAAWLLPNTEKLFKQWWKIFIDMLLVFPVIGLVFGASKLVSRILTSVYAGNATPDGTPTSVAVVASISTNGHGNLIGQIIAAAVLVVPLFAVPFILKGLLDSVPVAGKWAQKAYGSAVGGTRKQAQKHSDQFLGGFQAQKRAGVRSWWGGRRSKEAQARRRTFSQAWNDTKKSFDDNKKSYEDMASSKYKERAAKRPDTLAGRAIRRSEQEEVRSAAASSILGAELAHEKGDRSTQVGQWELQRSINASKQAHAEGKTAKEWEEMQAAPKDPGSAVNQQYARDLAAAGTTREELVRRSQETTGFTQAKSTAANQRQIDYSDALARTINGGGSDEDKSLLEIAGGTVDVVAGQKRAQAYGVQQARDIASKNVLAARSVAQSLMDKQQLKIIQSNQKNAFGEPLDVDGNVIAAPNTILDGMLKNGDMYEALAARDEYMTQGQAGVVSGLRSIVDLEEQGRFNSPQGQEVLAQIKRTQLSEHGKATKENATWAVRWAQGSETGREAMANSQSRFLGQTDVQLAGQAPSSMLVGIANGAVDETTAERILGDDRRRNNFDEGQIQMLQMLKDHGAEAVLHTWNPDTGKRWVDEKDTSVSKKATYVEWASKMNKARASKPSTAADPESVPSDEPDTSPIPEGILAGDKRPPEPGSPTAALKQYADKAGGVERMSHTTFVEFNKAVAAAPDRNKEDNEDYGALVSQINSDVNRRNREAEKINKTINETLQVPLGPSAFATTYAKIDAPQRRRARDGSPTSNNTPPPAQATFKVDTSGDVSPNQGSTSGGTSSTPSSDFAQRLTRAARAYNISDLSQLGLSRDEVQRVYDDPVKQSQLSNVFNDFTDARGRVLNSDPQQVENLRTQLLQAIRRVVDEG